MGLQRTEGNGGRASGDLKVRWSRGSGGEVPASLKELHESILRLAKENRHREAELLDLFRKMDAADGHRAFGCYSMVAYIELTLGVDDATAREKLRVARALKDLPDIESSHREGRLSYSQVRATTRVATPETQEHWLTLAKKLTAQELEWEVARSRRGEPRPRRLWMKPIDSRMTRLIVELPAEEMELIRQAIDKIRKQAEGPISDSQALVYMAAETLNGNPSDGMGPSPYQVVIHVGGDVSAEAYDAGEDGATQDWPPEGLVATSCGQATVSPAKVEEVLCDGTVVTVRHLEDETVETTERARAIPAATRRAILRRDGRQCQVPGCRNRLWLDLHHRVPWWKGGEHTGSNLLTVCRRHHGELHEGRITIRGPSTPGGPLRFFAGEWEMS